LRTPTAHVRRVIPVTQSEITAADDKSGNPGGNDRQGGLPQPLLPYATCSALASFELLALELLAFRPFSFASSRSWTRRCRPQHFVSGTFRSPSIARTVRLAALAFLLVTTSGSAQFDQSPRRRSSIARPGAVRTTRANRSRRWNETRLPEGIHLANGIHLADGIHLGNGAHLADGIHLANGVHHMPPGVGRHRRRPPVADRAGKRLGPFPMAD
jgi:hypothetical protein